jgi:hypothetical protein
MVPIVVLATSPVSPILRGRWQYLNPFKAAARSFAEPIAAAVRDTSELESVVAALTREPNGGLIVQAGIAVGDELKLDRRALALDDAEPRRGLIAVTRRNERTCTGRAGIKLRSLWYICSAR